MDPLIVILLALLAVSMIDLCVILWLWTRPEKQREDFANTSDWEPDPALQPETAEG